MLKRKKLSENESVGSDKTQGKGSFTKLYKSQAYSPETEQMDNT
jgi:hypothetical protein